MLELCSGCVFDIAFDMVEQCSLSHEVSGSDSWGLYAHKDLISGLNISTFVE